MLPSFHALLHVANLHDVTGLKRYITIAPLFIFIFHSQVIDQDLCLYPLKLPAIAIAHGYIEVVTTA